MQGYRVQATPKVEVKLGPLPMSVMHFVVPALIALVAFAFAGCAVATAARGPQPEALRCVRTGGRVACEEWRGAPLQLQGWPGHHWYVVPRVGFPDPETFHAAYRKLAALHDELWERTGLTPAQTVLGGFSMGTVMSYALGLGGDRPVPAGILAFSGFLTSNKFQ